MPRKKNRIITNRNHDIFRYDRDICVTDNSSGGSSSSVDSSAFFAAVGDMPSWAQTATNTLMNSLQSIGVFSNLSFAYLFQPTLTNSKGLIEYVSKSTIGSFGDVVSTAPFNTRGSTIAPMRGFIIDGSYATSYLRSGVIPSVRFSPYNHCILQTITGPLASATTNFDMGCFKTSPSLIALTMNNWYNGNLQRSQCYNNTTGQGLYSGSGATGAAGTYWLNAGPTLTTGGYNSSTRFSSATQGGSLPDIQMFVGTASNNGSPGTINGQVLSSYVGFNRALTSTELSNVVTALNQFTTDMYRNNWNMKFVTDGNSHTTYWNEKTNTTLQYNLGGRPIEFVSFGVSGQTTTQMIADMATQIQNARNPSYLKNFLYFQEITNDMIVAGKTVAEAMANAQTYVANALSYGYDRVFIKKQFCRGQPTSGAGLATYPNATVWNLAVDEINSILDTNPFPGNVTILPVDSTHFIPRANYASDAAYNTAVTALLAANFYDGTHLTQSGYKTEVDLVTPIINSFI